MKMIWEFAKETATVKAEGYTVRLALYKDKTMLCARDVLTLCGIGYPDRWISRVRKERSDISFVKLSFPFTTDAGPRQIKMIFVDINDAKKILSNLNCSVDAQKWLEAKVFTYEFPKMESEKKEEPVPNAPTHDVAKEDDDTEDINRRIDRILFELLDIKRSIVKM